MFDLIVVGGGSAGMPAAIHASRRGARVLILEAAARLGGTLLMPTGQLAAAGTRLQKSKGIVDSPRLHFDDVMRISKGTANPALLRLAVDNGGDTFDWLMDNGLQVGADHPILGTTHEPYSQPRYAWSPDKLGMAILEILERELAPELAHGGVTLLTNTQAKELITDGDAVVGVVAESEDGKLARHFGKHVLLTCGGFASNPTMFERIDGFRKYDDSSYPHSKGAGVNLARSVGGFVRGGELHTPLFGGILESADYPSPLLQMFRPWPATRPPWEIWVNSSGQRFVAEDIPSHDAVEEALLEQDGSRAWVVFDHEAIQKAPQILSSARWTFDEYLAMFNAHDFFCKADTLEELADAAGIDAGGLVTTVADYNKGRSRGRDQFGRQHLPAPIAKPPYYAIATHSWSFISFGGVAVDDELRVIRKDNTPIEGLYAAGEVIGAAQTMGKSQCGGMCLTPALTFGRLLGQKMLNFQPQTGE